MFRLNIVRIGVILLMLIGLLTAISIFFIKKVKRKLLCITVIAVLTGAFFTIRYQIQYHDFIDFQKTVQKEYPEIRKMELDYIGPHCWMRVYLNEKESSDVQRESIFIFMMQQVNQSPMTEFLKENPKTKKGTLCYFHIEFYQEKECISEFRASMSDYKWFLEEWEEEQIWTEQSTFKRYPYIEYKQGL